MEKIAFDSYGIQYIKGGILVKCIRAGTKESFLNRNGTWYEIESYKNRSSTYYHVDDYHSQVYQKELLLKNVYFHLKHKTGDWRIKEIKMYMDVVYGEKINNKNADEIYWKLKKETGSPVSLTTEIDKRMANALRKNKYDGLITYTIGLPITKSSLINISESTDKQLYTRITRKLTEKEKRIWEEKPFPDDLFYVKR